MEFKGYIIKFVIIFVVRCDSQFQYSMEGENVDLNFPYPCDSARVTLQCGMRKPFYTLVADSESLSLPPVQKNRFTVQNNSESNDCSLHLSITPVKRTDAGTYISLAYANDGTTTNERIGVHVDFLPGKASCTLNEESTFGNWVELNCIALVGSLSGQIDCYQNGERMPPKIRPVENNKHLEQTILVQRTADPVFCCTSILEQPKIRCECHDFQWDSSHGTILNSAIDPCVSTTTKQAQLVTTGVPSVLVSQSVQAKSTNETEIESKKTMSWTYWPYIPISILLLIIGLLILKQIWKSKQGKRKSLKCKYTQPSTPDVEVHIV